jgi:tetratricopeptide (TPR) repeat protein
MGDISLKRAKGTLEVRATPAPSTITIQGPEFAAVLTNSPVTTLSVPTDRYVIEAQYSHHRESGETSVTMNTPGSWTFRPRLGTVTLTCNRIGASFQLLTSDSDLVEGGNLPFTIQDLAEARYTILAWHHGNQRSETLMMKAGMTNRLEIEFPYGAAIFETEPSGATVATENGRVWGTTPLIIEELLPGRWKFLLRREGYEVTPVALDITTQQTNSFRTNLVSVDYVRAIAAAWEYLARADYDRALTAATDALQVKPNDRDAIAAQNEAVGKRGLHQAEKLGQQGDYIAAVKELLSTLQLLPDSKEAKQLLADFKKHEPEQIERLKQERRERPKKIFDSVLGGLNDSALFDSHELKTSNSVMDAKIAILNAFRNERPVFQEARVISSDLETFAIEVVQRFSTVLATSAGHRQCIIVGGQTREGETQILFKVLEYKPVAVNKFSIGALIGTPAEVTYVAVHKSRMEMTDKLQARVKEGIQIVTDRIQRTIN